MIEFLIGAINHAKTDVKIINNFLKLNRLVTGTFTYLSPRPRHPEN